MEHNHIDFNSFVLKVVRRHTRSSLNQCTAISRPTPSPTRNTAMVVEEEEEEGEVMVIPRMAGATTWRLFHWDSSLNINPREMCCCPKIIFYYC